MERDAERGSTVTLTPASAKIRQTSYSTASLPAPVQTWR